MKKTNLLALVAAVSIAFTSCSTEEGLLQNQETTNLLKTVTVKRDATGSYSLDYGVANAALVDKNFDGNTNTKQFDLYSSQNNTLTNFTEDLSIEGTQFKVGFKDTNTNNNLSITVLDDDLTTMSKSKTRKKLKSFNITRNSDGTFNLNFNVDTNVVVDFVYNSDLESYEIHLENGISQNTSFTRVIENNEGKALNFAFVNHLENIKTKTVNGSVVLSAKPIRKPVIIIDEGEDS
jgi:hypothetical protein